MRQDPRIYITTRFSQFRGPWHILLVDGTTVCGRTPPKSSVRGQGFERDYRETDRCASCWRMRMASTVVPELAEPPKRQLGLFDR